MPKNKGKGGKNRRRGKNDKDDEKRELVEKESNQQVYGLVLKMLGSGRLNAHCYDGKTRMCLIRGKLRKKSWICNGDTILIALRDYQDDKGDVILKYSADEARILKAQGHLPENDNLNELGDDHNEGKVEFVDATGAELSDNEVGQQHRNYEISSSGSDTDSDDDDDSKDSEVDDKAIQIQRNQSFSEESESSDSEEEVEEDDDELIAQRSELHKPGARDKSRAKGKRGK